MPPKLAYPVPRGGLNGLSPEGRWISVGKFTTVGVAALCGAGRLAYRGELLANSPDDLFSRLNGMSSCLAHSPAIYHPPLLPR